MERVNVAVSAETERQNKMAGVKKGAQVNQVVTNQEPGWASQNSSEDPANKKKSTKSKKKLTDEDKDKLTATFNVIDVNSLVNRYVTIALSVNQVNTLQEGVRRARETATTKGQGEARETGLSHACTFCKLSETDTPFKQCSKCKFFRYSSQPASVNIGMNIKHYVMNYQTFMNKS